MSIADREPTNDVAVLVSGGIDSAVLTVELTRHFRRVLPLYVRFGLRWELAELAGLREFLRRVARPAVAPLEVLDEPIAEVYGDHWSVAGPEVPGAADPDEDVYLPGRNLLLVAKASVWCQLRGVGALALGSLASNPFADGSTGFFDDLEAVVNRGINGSLRLIRPFDRWSKTDVMRRGAELPLESTFSCLDPADHQHCGICNKCEERRRAFRSVGLVDPTNYRRASSSNEANFIKESRCTE